MCMSRFILFFVCFSLFNFFVNLSICTLRIICFSILQFYLTATLLRSTCRASVPNRHASSHKSSVPYLKMLTELFVFQCFFSAIVLIHLSIILNLSNLKKKFAIVFKFLSSNQIVAL